MLDETKDQLKCYSKGHAESKEHNDRCNAALRERSDAVALIKRLAERYRASEYQSKGKGDNPAATPSQPPIVCFRIDHSSPLPVILSRNDDYRLDAKRQGPLLDAAFRNIAIDKPSHHIDMRLCI